MIDTKEDWVKIQEPNNIKDWINVSSDIGINYKGLWIKTSEEIFEGLLVRKKALSSGLLYNTTQKLSQLDCNNQKVKGSEVLICLTSIRKDMWSLSDLEKFSKEIQVHNKKDNTFKLGSFSELNIIEVEVIIKSNRSYYI